jgi:hypothetical protein
MPKQPKTSPRIGKAARQMRSAPPHAHQPAGKKKERPASKGRVRKGRSRT